MAFPTIARIAASLKRIPNGLLIALFGICVIAATWINVNFRIGYEHAEELKRFSQENSAKTRAFEEHTRRVLKAADGALLYLQTEYAKRGRVSKSMSDFVQWAKYEPGISQLAVADPAGDLVLSALPLPRPVNIADREHFVMHLQSSSRGLQITKPVISRVTGTWTFFMSRRLSAPDGSFGGVVAVGLSPSYFSDYYDTLALGVDRSMMLIGTDGIIRFRRFNNELTVGRDLSRSPLFDQVRRSPSGTYQVRSAIDGKMRISSYQVMQDFPLVVVVAHLRESALASFAQRQRSYYQGATLFTCFVACFSLLLIRAEGRTRRQNERIAEGLAQREKAAEALRESQDLFSEFINNLPAVAFVKDLQNRVLYSNQAFHELFGHDMVGRNLREFSSEDAGLLLREPGEACALPGGEETVVDLKGRQRTFDTRRFLVERGAKEPLVGVIAVDISGRRHAQKLEAIGTLAGGVAHDFNNIMTAIIGFASLLQLKLPPGGATRGYVDNILAASDRAAHLTRSLLAFGRKQESLLREVDLNQVLHNIEKLLRPLISEEIEIRTEFPEDAVPVMADSGQIEQVLMNLVLNARDAMPSGGRLTLRLEALSPSGSHPELRRLGAAQGCCLAVSDTGSGIEAQTLQRIFEPFFTTKEVGKGTGLGLSLVYGIVKQHEGFVDVQTEPGAGSTFRIYLPVVAPQGGEAAPVTPGPVAGGCESILLAEDDPEVRCMTRQVLEEFGYRVVMACDGAEAVSRFAEHADEIRLVILDVIMPKKNGKEACHEIRALAPQARVLFTSGYTADVISGKGILQENLFFVAKPVAPATLLRKVREILDLPP